MSVLSIPCDTPAQTYIETAFELLRARLFVYADELKNAPTKKHFAHARQMARETIHENETAWYAMNEFDLRRVISEWFGKNSQLPAGCSAVDVYFDTFKTEAWGILYEATHNHEKNCLRDKGYESIRFISTTPTSEEYFDKVQFLLMDAPNNDFNFPLKPVNANKPVSSPSPANKGMILLVMKNLRLSSDSKFYIEEKTVREAYKTLHRFEREVFRKVKSSDALNPFIVAPSTCSIPRGNGMQWVRRMNRPVIKGFKKANNVNVK